MTWKNTHVLFILATLVLTCCVQSCAFRWVMADIAGPHINIYITFSYTGSNGTLGYHSEAFKTINEFKFVNNHHLDDEMLRFTRMGWGTEGVTTGMRLRELRRKTNERKGNFAVWRLSPPHLLWTCLKYHAARFVFFSRHRLGGHLGALFESWSKKTVSFFCVFFVALCFYLPVRAQPSRPQVVSCRQSGRPVDKVDFFISKNARCNDASQKELML